MDLFSNFTFCRAQCPPLLEPGIIDKIVSSLGQIRQKILMADVFPLVAHRTHLGSHQETKTHFWIQFLEVQFPALTRVQGEVTSSSATPAASPPIPPTGMTGWCRWTSHFLQSSLPENFSFFFVKILMKFILLRDDSQYTKYICWSTKVCNTIFYTFILIFL